MVLQQSKQQCAHALAHAHILCWHPGRVLEECTAPVVGSRAHAAQVLEKGPLPTTTACAATAYLLLPQPQQKERGN